MSRNIFALADCNSAYASFECVFAPWLKDRPIVSLSNNDGNVVARNALAKQAGIKMGQPWHELRDMHRRGELVVFSSNFALYGSISNRVMRVLASHACQFSQYSIDEGWLLMTGLTLDIEQHCRMIQQDVRCRVGVPIGIGIAHTKVLAKLANWASKKWVSKTGGVVDLRDEVRIEKLLKYAPVEEVWGIGPRLAKRLGEGMGITTAWQLATAPAATLRKQLGVTVERTARELNGIQCFDLEDGPALKQSITSSRSFGQKVYRQADLESAVATFVAKSAAKLRAQGSMCQLMQVFARTSPFRDGPKYGASRTLEFTTPTSDTRHMTAAAMAAVADLYRPNVPFAKAGVVLSSFVEAAGYTPDLFAPETCPRSERLMAVVDAINRREGVGTVRLARERGSGAWPMRQDFLSPRYTTRWSDLPVANANV
jgi:DNA polymerase V